MTDLDLSKMSEADVGRALALLEESLLADEAAIKVLKAARPTKVAFVARDTGRKVTVELGGGRLSCRPGDGMASDVTIEATEETLAGVVSGEIDVDAAYFSGRLRIRGSLAAAFKLRVKLLGLVQAHASKLRVPSALVRIRGGS